MTLLDTTDARNPTPYARELAEQHRARRARFAAAYVPAIEAPKAVAEQAVEEAPQSTVLRITLLRARWRALANSLPVGIKVKRKLCRQFVAVLWRSDLKWVEIVSSSRKRRVAIPRHELMIIAAQYEDKGDKLFSCLQISRIFGRVDSTTTQYVLGKAGLANSKVRKPWVPLKDRLSAAHDAERTLLKKRVNNSLWYRKKIPVTLADIEAIKAIIAGEGK